MGAFDLNLPRRLANCKADIGLCNENFHYSYFVPKNCFVLNVLTISLKIISVDVNYVLKLVLQV
jgi:hypothetical protein